MRNGSTAECAVAYVEMNAAIDSPGGEPVLRRKAIPWRRIIVDALLFLGLVAASSSVLLQR
jgi:hypothetical protein